MNKIILLFFLTLWVCKSDAQVTIEKSVVDYSLKTEDNHIIRILTFGKDKDSADYNTVKYTITNFNQPEEAFLLKNEINTIQKLWEIAEDSLKFKLRSFHVGYPLQYADIFKNHIQAFMDSKDWQNHIEKNGKKLVYPIIQNVMHENDIYKPLHDFLKSKGYIISGFDTEKHGFVTKENLQKAGFSGNEIIPMPYIVWLSLDQL